MTTFCHTSTGVLKYEPSGSWCRLTCDRDIIRYYQWLLLRYGVKLAQLGSTHGAHVTVVRGEEPPRPEFWGWLDGEAVEFWYSHDLRRTDYHVWLDVYCPALVGVREKLGFPPKLQKRLTDGRVLEHSFHLSIGRLR